LQPTVSNATLISFDSAGESLGFGLSNKAQPSSLAINNASVNLPLVPAMDLLIFLSVVISLPFRCRVKTQKQCIRCNWQST
jgi:hypothetical protein